MQQLRYPFRKQIRIKYHEDIDRIEQIAIGDWIDLRAAHTMAIPKNQTRKVSLGVSMQLPKGYEAHLIPRSSFFKNFKCILVNSKGVIDNIYCGDNDIWFAELMAFEDTVIRKNDRIMQFRIVKKMPKLNIVEVSRLGNPDRGGHGSTGTK